MHSTISVPPGFAYGEDEEIPDMPTPTDIVDAAYHLAHGYPGGIAALAARLQMSASTLEKKVNPNNTTHHLTPREMVAMQFLSGDASVLHAMAHALGYTVMRAMPDQSEGNPVEAFAVEQVAQGEYSRQVADVMRSGQPPSRNDLRRIDEAAGDLHTAIGNLNAVMRGRMRLKPREE